MQNNVIELIIYLVRRVHFGVSLKDIRLDKIHGYNKAEISAAYSWLLQKYDSGELKQDISKLRKVSSPRVLHSSERTLISPEAYGYLLELYYLGIIDEIRMERMIEYAMFRPDGKTETNDIKEWVAKMIFDNEHNTDDQSLLLQGNETIN